MPNDRRVKLGQKTLRAVRLVVVTLVVAFGLHGMWVAVTPDVPSGSDPDEQRFAMAALAYAPLTYDSFDRLFARQVKVVEVADDSAREQVEEGRQYVCGVCVMARHQDCERPHVAELRVQTWLAIPYETIYVDCRGSRHESYIQSLWPANATLTR